MKSENKLAIIGIDSLDPYVILKHRELLPNFSTLIEGSPTFVSKSVFPVDTIPAWASIYTGLHPGNHGLLYVYDVFDPTLSDLRKLDISRIKGRTFWDIAGKEGFRVVVVFPMLMYPAWEVNGVMVSKSPFERRIDWLRTERDTDVCPLSARDMYGIPEKIDDLWGGFPGLKSLESWAELGKEILEKEKNLGLMLFEGEKWDLFFIYFSILDIIQHRLWRFFDENDPTYCENHLSGIILEYYKMFDRVVGEFVQIDPGVSMIVMSDHGHMSRPYKTANLNEYLRHGGYLASRGQKIEIMRNIRKTLLEVANHLDIEHRLIEFISGSHKLTKVGKSVYSLEGSIDKKKSKAYLSTFAGIKSYPHGGIEINRSLVSEMEYERTREELIEFLSLAKTQEGKPLLKWIKKREDIFGGRFAEEIYPDIVFELDENYGVGWDVHSGLYGKAYDHKVASGGHARDAVFLIRNINKEIEKKEINIIDVAPTILDILGAERRRFEFDGGSIFGG